MRILYFCTTWGQKMNSWDEFFSGIISHGYQGVETDLPAEGEQNEFMEGLDKYGLKFIAQHWETTDVNLKSHQQEYEERLHKLAALKPLFINSHTGRDFFSWEQNCSLLDSAQKIEKETGVRIVHETHRSRFAYAAHVTAPFLNQRPELQLTLDVSHWCAVAESLLQDQPEAVNLAIKHTAHIHARVGFAQGPQVADPSLPEYAEALAFHLNCWDKVVENYKGDILTITPEFGPIPYMPHHLPQERQWQNNLYIMNLLKNRYQLNQS
ncbi:sugar phosphate isomerase/epimerase family protein [Pedobacter hiemivivus]|nr:sugar phosphate isomerase/epimerase [Pedobacter hiemivivus]